MKLPESIIGVLSAQKGMITSQDISALGISRTMLGKYVSAGLLERSGRGLYTGANGLIDEIFALCKRCNRIVFSHATALFLLGKSERTPFNHYATIKSGETIPQTLRQQLKCFYVKDELFDVGRIEVQTQFGNVVPCYNLERTICDVIRSRNKLGTETFLNALKLYAISPLKDLNKLYSYAKSMKIYNILRHYLEVLL